MNRLLDARLRAVAAAVRPGSVVADVGTDHGYLACALVEAGHCPRAYASDVHPMPLEVAKAHIHQRGLAQRIETVLSDGLLALPGGEIDDVVIAGMGGELIGRILTEVPWTRDPDKRFVLQPMTRAAQLRVLLCRAGFRLLEETTAESGRFVYTVMTAAYTGDAWECGELFAQTGLVWQGRAETDLLYLDRVRRRLLKQAAGLRDSRAGKAEAGTLLALAEEIDRRLEEADHVPGA